MKIFPVKDRQEMHCNFLAWSFGLALRLCGLVFATLLFCSFSHAIGGQVGNGGDAVRCDVSSTDRFKGLYALDYLLTLGADGQELGTVEVASWDDSKARILKNLSAKSPLLARSFQAFLADINNTRDWTQPRIWLPAPQGLINLNDQEIIRELPKNCDQSSDSQSVNLIQAVVRLKKPGIIEYEMDMDILLELMSTPVQFSYLMVHEWLWDRTADVQAIRWANQLIHSSQLDTLSAADLNKSLSNIGIDVTSEP